MSKERHRLRAGYVLMDLLWPLIGVMLRYTKWYEALNNNPSEDLLRQVAWLLAAQTDVEELQKNGNEVGLTISEVDILGIMMVFAPEKQTYKVMADSLELAAVKWAGVDLSIEDEITTFPFADDTLVRVSLNLDMSRFFSRPGYSKTRTDIETAWNNAERLFDEEIIRGMLAHQKPVQTDRFLSAFSNVHEDTDAAVDPYIENHSVLIVEKAITALIEWLTRKPGTSGRLSTLETFWADCYNQTQDEKGDRDAPTS